MYHIQPPIMVMTLNCIICNHMYIIYNPYHGNQSLNCKRRGTEFLFQGIIVEYFSEPLFFGNPKFWYFVFCHLYLMSICLWLGVETEEELLRCFRSVTGSGQKEPRPPCEQMITRNKKFGFNYFMIPLFQVWLSYSQGQCWRCFISKNFPVNLKCAAFLPKS